VKIMLADRSVSPSELIRAARAGKSDAVGRLLSLYVNYLKILATTQLDPKLRRRVSPSDVVQETFCDAHRDFPRFRGESEGQFVAWLRRILIHNLARFVELHVLTEKRDIRRELSMNEMRQAVDRSSNQMDALFIGKEGTPSGAAIKRERSVLLADCLSELPDDYRQVVLLRNFQGLPFNEVAQQMDRSSGAVRMLWLRALEQLREQLGAQLVDGSK
jgi:RNA polymerase sigma-70 factor (ECF subfamily)